GVADERNLITICPDKLRERIAEFSVWLISPDGIFLGVLLRHLFRLIEAIKDGLQYRHGRRANCAVVEIDLIVRDEELLANLAPIGLCVAVKKRLRRKRRQSDVRQLRLSKRLECGKCGDAGGGREKDSTV